MKRKFIERSIFHNIVEINGVWKICFDFVEDHFVSEFERLSKVGDLEGMKLIWKLGMSFTCMLVYHTQPRNYFWKKWPLSIACKKGHLPIVQWLSKMRFSSVFEDKTRWDLAIACKKGKLDVVQWIFKHQTISNHSREFAFTISCLHGHTELVEWFFTSNNVPRECDAYPSKDGIATQLNTNDTPSDNVGELTTSPTYKSNMHRVFVHSCLHNNLKTAKWLWTLPIVHTSDVVKEAKETSHPEILEWISDNAA
jgi:hypothetical protein